MVNKTEYDASLDASMENRNSTEQLREGSEIIKVGDKERDEFAKFILTIPNDEPEISNRRLNKLGELIDCIRIEQNDVGSNVFGLLQGVTKFTTHNLKSEDTFGSVLGRKSWYNQKAYNKCMEFVK